MRRHFLAGLATMAISLAVPAHAGPLLDRLRERRAEREAGSDVAEDGTAPAADAGGGRRTFTPPEGIEVERDIAYGDDPRHRLDVFRRPGTKDAPVLLMVHGGGWRRGDKGGPSMVGNKVKHWVGRGWVLVSINYRLVPQVNPAQQAEDVARALAFAQGKARSWGGDPSRFVLMGHSAGAHLVALVTADGSPAMRLGAQPWLATVAIDSAALDVEAVMNRRHHGLYDTAFGSDPALWREASPMARLRGKPAAPILLVCSSRRDDSCPPAEAFAARANGFGGRAKVLPIELNHAQINDRLGTDGEYTDAVNQFLRSAGLP
jgi:acetyl esterase/lipase